MGCRGSKVGRRPPEQPANSTLLKGEEDRRVKFEENTTETPAVTTKARVTKFEKSSEIDDPQAEVTEAPRTIVFFRNTDSPIVHQRPTQDPATNIPIVHERPEQDVKLEEIVGDKDVKLEETTAEALTVTSKAEEAVGNSIEDQSTDVSLSEIVDGGDFEASITKAPLGKKLDNPAFLAAELDKDDSVLVTNDTTIDNYAPPPSRARFPWSCSCLS